MANAPDIDFIGRSDPLSNAEARDLLAAYNGLRAFEGDFDKAQGQLRAIASAWLLAGIGAVGFLVSAQANHTMNPPAGLAAGLATMSRQILFFFVALGLSSIWTLDQKIYQNLLHSVFALGYWMEFKNKNLPPTRMKLYRDNKDITSELGLFYSRPILVVLICAAVNFTVPLYVFFSVLFIQRQAEPMEYFFNTIWNDGFLEWIICAIVLGLHFRSYLYFEKNARTWARLAALLPDEAELTTLAPHQAPDRLGFQTSVCPAIEGT